MRFTANVPVKGKAKNPVKLIGGIFFLVGMIMFIAGIGFFISNHNFMSKAESTQGIITAVSLHSGNRSKGSDVTVEYRVNGTDYSAVINEYTTNMHVGDHMTVYYDPHNPYDARTDSNFMSWIFTGIGALFAAIGGVFIVAIAKGGMRRKKLMQSGEVMTGIIINVVPNMKVRINGMHPYKAECEVIDYSTGGRYLYSSESYTQDISQYIGSEVTVYVDRNDRSRYYVDMDGLISQYMQSSNTFDYR